MNKAYVIWNLREAQEELGKILQEIENVDDYGFGEFSVAMAHLYHHLNTSWNAKDSTVEQSDACSEADFMKWRQFPVDIYLGD